MAQKMQYEEVIETNGIKVPFISRIITPKIEAPMRDESYVSGECEKLRAILCPGDRVLELGTGIGLISSVVAKVDGIEAITTIEANPELIPMIEETHRLNDIFSVDLRNGVVVASDRKRSPYFLRRDFWASSPEPETHAYLKKKHLPCFNINSLIEETRPTVIVCDIKGGDIGLFEGADLSGVRAMIVEFHPQTYGAESVDVISRSIAAKGLALQQPDELSSVRHFSRVTEAPAATEPTATEAVVPEAATPERSENAPVAADSVDTPVIVESAAAEPEADAPAVVEAVSAPATSSHPVYPDLRGLKNKPWDPKSARFLISTCMKDEGPFIVEWVAWHKSIGINDIVVFTNDCTDGTDLLLDRLEEMGQLRHFPNPALASDSTSYHPFVLAYTPYLSEFKRADFYISMDVDEFINIRLGTGQMSDLLEETGPFDALSISELNHGSNMIENYERGLLTEQFPRHQREAPGRQRSRRGVKTIVRRGENLHHIRNHRPDLRTDNGPVTWLNGSGRPLESLHADMTQKGIDVRKTYELVVLDHFSIRSLNSYLVKMFRGDAVVKNKMVSQRYWSQRDRYSDLTSTFERQKTGFQKVYDRLMADETLAKLHDNCCAAHEGRIAKLLKIPVFQDRKKWIFDSIWAPMKAKLAAKEQQADTEKEAG